MYPRSQCGAVAAKTVAPALIGPIEEDAGVVAIHRTFLRPDGRGKADMDEPKRMLGNPGFGAVRWGGIPLNGVLRLAEGVEDAASVMNLLGAGHFVWPVLGIERYQARSEEHTSELQSLMRISYAVFCLKNKHYPENKKKKYHKPNNN